MTTKKVADNSKSATVIDVTNFKKTILESSESRKLSKKKNIRRLDVNWPPKEHVEYDQQDHLKLKWIMQKFEDEPDLKQIMQEDGELGPVYSDLLATGGKGIPYLLSDAFNWLDKLKVCIKFIREDDRILDDIERSLRKKRRKQMAQNTPAKTEISEDFHHCIENNDQIAILDLIQKRQCQDQHKLEELCKKFGRKHPLTKLACMKICEFIKRENPNLSDIWPAYKMITEKDKVDETNICFFLEMKETEQIKLKNINVQITRKSPNDENKVIIYYAYDQQIRLTGSDISRIGEVINKEISRLSEQHRNLAMIVPSPIKSIGYKTTNHQKKLEKCIALFVPAKGIIPLQEDCFPKKLGDFVTDVREDYCEWAVGGGPHDSHDPLKIGCAIASLGSDLYGTLGGFLDHKDHGLCALTSDHVFPKYHQTCVQPPGSRRSHGFGKQIMSCFDGEKGVDATLIKIDKRYPSGGQFPDCSHEEMVRAGITDANGLVYTSGKIESVNESTFDACSQRIIMKYGATTTFRRGQLTAFDCPVPKPVKYSEIQKKTFRHQIVISSISKYGKFAEKGDSGALVCMLTDEGLVALGVVMAVTEKGYTYVNQIETVLKEFGCMSLKSFHAIPKLDKSVAKAEIEKDNTETLDTENNADRHGARPKSTCYNPRDVIKDSKSQKHSGITPYKYDQMFGTKPTPTQMSRSRFKRVMGRQESKEPTSKLTVLSKSKPTSNTSQAGEEIASSYSGNGPVVIKQHNTYIDNHNQTK